MDASDTAAVDAAIAAGNTAKAIRLYCAATGANEPQARAYVERRAAVFRSVSAIVPRVARIGVSLGVIGGALGIAVGALAVLLFAVPALFPGLQKVSIGAFHPFDLGGRMIASSFTSEPYYPRVIERIQASRKFRAILGAPIAIDNDVSCNYISDDPTQKKANCTIPVHGPKASGGVHVQIVDTSGSLDLGAWLHIGDQSISMDS